jgi:hypothetical protein
MTWTNASILGVETEKSISGVETRAVIFAIKTSGAEIPNHP